MLSLDYIRNNKEKVIAAVKNKQRTVDIEKIIVLDDERKTKIQTIQTFREERNILSKKKVDNTVIKRGKEIKLELKNLEDTLDKIEKELKDLLSMVPNVPLTEVPVGKDAQDNVETKKWGTIPSFDFTPLSHVELGLRLDIMDFERGAKVSGFRGCFLKNEGAMLHMALLFYTLQKLQKKGFIPMIAPAIVKSFALFGTGQFPWGKQEVYALNDTDAYLAGTSEVPITAYYANEIIAEQELPKKFVALSPCFRREAGAYGKDTKGLYRLHEFWKIEQVILAKNNIEIGKNHLEELQKNSEEILEELGLPYRVMLMCTGEMGEPQMKKYDIETWMPSRESYGETMSNSLMGDFQTRRLSIKYRKKDGRTEYCYSLNNTALASPRILIALLENFQQKDRSITIPKVLHQYTGFTTIHPKT